MAGSVHQFVYRQVVKGQYIIEPIPDYSFCLFESIGDGLGIAGALRRRFGIIGTSKILLKLAGNRRKFYCILFKDEIVNYGWAALSFCRHYDVREGDVVVGPVWTDPSYRSKGLAVHGMKNLINQMLSRGHSVYFVDTAESNWPMQRVIDKCGFGKPVFLYDRNGEIN